MRRPKKYDAADNARQAGEQRAAADAAKVAAMKSNGAGTPNQ